MRFMLIIKSSSASESGVMPSPELLEAMGKFNEEMVNAGVMLGGEGLHPSAKGARIKFSAGKATVTDGPFGPADQLIAGFWILQTRSRAEAIEWATRIPGGTSSEVDHNCGDFEVELRQIFDAADFDYAPAEVEREARLRAAVDNRKAS